jgi:hypothetical protein
MGLMIKNNTNLNGEKAMATMVTVKGSDIGRTVNIEQLAGELNSHPNGGFIHIAGYEDNKGVVTNQWLRLCPTSEQKGAGYISAKASDLKAVQSCIEALKAGEVPTFGDSLRIRRGAKLATAGHKTAKVGEEVSGQTKKFCTSILTQDYPIPANDERIMTALLDIERSILNPSDKGQADYQGEGDKGLFSLDNDGVPTFYLREVYSHYSCEALDENGKVISGYKEKTTGEPKAIKDALGKALGLRRSKYRTFVLSPNRFDHISIAKKVITMDGGAGEFSVIDPDMAKSFLGASMPSGEVEDLMASLL